MSVLYDTEVASCKKSKFSSRDSLVIVEYYLKNIHVHRKGDSLFLNLPQYLRPLCDVAPGVHHTPSFLIHYRSATGSMLK